MNKITLVTSMLLVAASMQAAPAALPFKGNVADSFNKSEIRNAALTPNREAMRRTSPFARISQTEPVATTNAGNYYTTLYSPKGETWYAVGNITETAGSCSAFSFTVYDADFKPLGSVADEISFDPAKGETRIVWVDIVPQVTQKFFNYDAQYELMVYIVANTSEAYGYELHERTVAYQLDSPAPIAEFEGNCISALDASADPWSETYYLTFMTVEESETTDIDGNINLADYVFSIYSKGIGYGSSPSEIAKLRIPTILLSGEDALPFLTRYVDGVPYFSINYLEKPFFENPFDYENENLSPDNHLIIDLYAYEGAYNKEFNLKKTTKIECDNPASMSEPFSMYYIGNFMGNDDLAFGKYGQTKLPAYIVTRADYQFASDGYLYNFFVYDADANDLGVIGTNIEYLAFMTDIPGSEPQVMFISSDAAAENYTFDFVDYYALATQLSVINRVGDYDLSASIDRVPTPQRPLYVCSLNTADSDMDGNAIHTFVYFTDKGDVDHIDRINLGKRVAYANPYVNGAWMTPYVFNTDDATEYAFLVKRFVTTNSSATVEQFVIVNSLGDKLMDCSQSAEKGSIYQVNMENGPLGKSIWLIWQKDGMFDTELFKLPLEKFAKGGDGSVDNPYLIASVADLQQIRTNPAAHYRIANDFSANGFVIEPIESFSGTLDGDGHVIKNLSINGPALFLEMTEGASVSNLWIDGATFTPTEYENGGLIASIAVGSKFNNVHVNRLIVCSGIESSFGGLVGSLYYNSSMTECSVAAAVIDAGKSAVGGLVYETRTGSAITKCAFSGEISANETIGGIVAESGNANDVIESCHVTANILGKHNVGGIAAESKRGKINNCIFDGIIVVTGPYAKYGVSGPVAGGIVGSLQADWAEHETAPDPVITGNIVNCTITCAAPSGKPKWANQFDTCHRIVGATGANEEPTTDDNGNSTADYVEIGLANNYAAIPLAEGLADGPDTIEGETIAEISRNLLEQLDYALGMTSESPWVYSPGKAMLYYEYGKPVFSQSIYQVTEGEQAEIQISIVGALNPAINEKILSIDLSNDGFTFMNATAEGRNVKVIVECNKITTCEITVNYGALSSTAMLVGTAGVEEISAATSDLKYDGTAVIAEGHTIEIYNLAGARVATGRDRVDIRHLTPGIYLAATPAATLKLLLK